MAGTCIGTQNAVSVAFRSGMSSRSDLRGAIDARTPVGVVAGHLTLRQKLMTVPY